MGTRYISAPMDVAYARPFAGRGLDADSMPIYQQVLCWLLLFPLLFHVANGQFSIFSEANNPLRTQAGNLLKMDQGMRPQIILYFVTMLLFVAWGYRHIWRVAIYNKLILSGIALGVVSAIWSHSRMLTLRMSFMLFLTTCFAFYLSDRFSTERIMRLMMFVGVVTVVLSLILIAFFPQYGVFHRGGGPEWQGICSHKNTLGFSLAFLLTPIFFTSHRLFLKVGYASLLLPVIALSRSRGAWFITAVMFMFVGWLALSRRLKNKDALLLSVASAVLVFGGILLLIIYLEPAMKAIGKDPTLTGRTGIYLAVLGAIGKQPILGYGLGAFWFGANPESLNVAREINWPGIGYAENGFLELALGLGAVGVGLALLLFGRAIRQASKLIRAGLYNPRIGWFCTIIFLELVTNIEGGIVMAPDNLNWTLTLIAFVGLAKELHDSYIASADFAEVYA